MKAARVPSLVRGDPTCLRTAKPTDRSYWSPYALKLMLGSKRSYWKEKPAQLESNPHLPQLEKACVQQWRSSAAKSKKIKKKWSKLQALLENVNIEPSSSWIHTTFFCSAFKSHTEHHIQYLPSWKALPHSLGCCWHPWNHDCVQCTLTWAPLLLPLIQQERVRAGRRAQTGQF